MIRCEADVSMLDIQLFTIVETNTLTGRVGNTLGATNRGKLSGSGRMAPAKRAWERTERRIGRGRRCQTPSLPDDVDDSYGRLVVDVAPIIPRSSPGSPH